MRSVEHAYAVSLSRWRTATFAASALAVVELVVLAVIGVTAVAHTVSRNVHRAAVEKVAGPAPVQRRTTRGHAVLARNDTGVLVLNANGVAGAAATAASSLRTRGYLVAGVGNADSQGSTRTLVMYRGAFRPEARRLAHEVGGAVVTPLDGMKPSQLLGAQLVLVLGS
jgi:hypothetical protein